MNKQELDTILELGKFPATQGLERTPIDLKVAMSHNAVEGWKMTLSQKKHLVQSTQELLQKHPLEWFKENQERLKEELKIVFKEI